MSTTLKYPRILLMLVLLVAALAVMIPTTNAEARTWDSCSTPFYGPPGSYGCTKTRSVAMDGTCGYHGCSFMDYARTSRYHSASYVCEYDSYIHLDDPRGSRYDLYYGVPRYWGCSYAAWFGFDTNRRIPDWTRLRAKWMDHWTGGAWKTLPTLTINED